MINPEFVKVELAGQRRLAAAHSLAVFWADDRRREAEKHGGHYVERAFKAAEQEATLRQQMDDRVSQFETYLNRAALMVAHAGEAHV